VKRSILLALVAALALSFGLSSLATANAPGDATASAKKGKGCKGKKGKGKASQSASASAKKKGKGKGCKGSKGGKGSWSLPVGSYDGQDGIGLTVKAGGTQASLIYAAGFGDEKTCIPVPLEFPAEPVTSTSNSFKAGGKEVPMLGGDAKARWTIEVKTDLRYKVVLDSSYAFPGQTPCDKPGATFTGTLKPADA
jgi:hypothetical protein